jgi:hypothetical protein
LVVPAKFTLSQRPALIWVLQSVETKDFGQFYKQARQTGHLQKALQKAWTFLGDHPQQPTDVVARSADQCIPF